MNLGLREMWSRDTPVLGHLCVCGEVRLFVCLFRGWGAAWQGAGCLFQVRKLLPPACTLGIRVSVHLNVCLCVIQSRPALPGYMPQGSDSQNYYFVANAFRYETNRNPRVQHMTLHMSYGNLPAGR